MFAETEKEHTAVRVGIVQADPSSRGNLSEVVSQRYPVAWWAGTGAEALQYCAEDPADLVLLDLGSPGAAGVELTSRLSGELDCDVLVLTSGCEARQTFEALAAGGLDLLNLPSSPELNADFLLQRLEVIDRILRSPRRSRRAKAPFPLVCLGASAGGPEAVAHILSGLEPDFPAGVVVLQHVAPPFVAGLAQFLGDRSALPVLLADPGEMPRPGEVLVAGRRGSHLGMGRRGVLARASLTGPRPSIDHFMSCAARYWPGTVVGILLTGLGDDGARGLLALRQKGHPTLVQDEASSLIFGMPARAIEMGAAERILSLDEIARLLASQEYFRACCS